MFFQYYIQGLMGVGDFYGVTVKTDVTDGKEVGFCNPREIEKTVYVSNGSCISSGPYHVGVDERFARFVFNVACNLCIPVLHCQNENARNNISVFHLYLYLYSFLSDGIGYNNSCSMAYAYGR